MGSPDDWPGISKLNQFARNPSTGGGARKPGKKLFGLGASFLSRQAGTT